MRRRWSISVTLGLVCVVLLQVGSFAKEPRKSEPPRRSLPPEEFDPQTREIFAGGGQGRLKSERPTERSSVQPATQKATAPESAFAWSKLISAETLVDEIKAYPVEIAKSVRNPGVFKSEGSGVARQHFSVIAAMFGIMAEYDGDVRWKRRAPGARDAFSAAGRNAKAADDNTFKESRQRSEDLDELIRGGSIKFDTADSAAGESKPLWHDIAERSPLMKRMETAVEERLRKWTASREEFQRNRESAVHEAEIVAALSEVIQREEYEFYDDDDYLEMCRELLGHATAATTAARENNFDEVQRAVGEMTKTCSACHEDYR